MPRVKQVLVGGLVATGLGGVAAFVAWCVYFFPGGLRSSYNAVDGDFLLTREARTAKPIIAAIEAYRREHGHVPPDLTVVPGARETAWRYVAVNPRAYALSLKLGWDPDLRYEVEGEVARWVFEPGDGSTTRTIALTP